MKTDRLHIFGLDKDTQKIIKKLSLLGIMLTFVVFMISAAMDISSLGRRLDETVEHLKRQCVSNDTIISADKVKSLIRLTEQAVEIADDVNRNPSLANAEYFKEYCEKQRLAGIMLLDADFAPEVDYSNRNMGYVDWRNEVSGKAVANIVKYPTKIYSERTVKNGKYYDLAVAARLDSKGVVCCYRYQDIEAMMISRLPIKNLMTGYELNFNGRVYITTDGTVLGSNSDKGESVFVSEIKELKRLDDAATDDLPTFFSVNGALYYGEKQQFKGYGLYAFYPLVSAMASTAWVPVLFAGLYVIVCMMFYLFRGYTEKRHILELNRQAQTIKAISNIYVMYIMIDIENNSFDIVKSPERVKEVFSGVSAASELLETICTRFVAEDCREEYAAFTELETLSERLGDKDYIEMVHCNDRGCWIRDIIIPNGKNANGRINSVILALRDIDELKKKEIEYQEKLKKVTAEAMRANAAKTDFLRRMSHDVRTPINVIMGMIEIGNSEPDNVKRQQYCREKAREATTMLLELVNDVLFVNKMDSDNSPPEEKPFDIRTVIGEVCSLIDIQAREKELEFIIEPLSTQHFRLLGNPLHLRQIIMNIAGNAVKYTPTGGKIRFSCNEILSDGEKSMLKFTCEDTGVGMSAEFQAHMFEPFEQEDDIPRTKYGGIGLGLSIVNSLVGKMGGNISVNSEKNKGTKFEIEIPFRIDPDEDQTDKIPKRTQPVSLDGARILVAEDNALNMEIAEFMLEEKGAVITKAWDGEQAAEIWKDSEPGTFDIILMDLMMPGMGGIEATRIIRESGRNDAKTVPIIAMSANIFAEDIERCTAAGMTGHIPKPLDMDKLTDIVSRYTVKKTGR